MQGINSLSPEDDKSGRAVDIIILNNLLALLGAVVISNRSVATIWRVGGTMLRVEGADNNFWL